MSKLKSFLYGFLGTILVFTFLLGWFIFCTVTLGFLPEFIQTFLALTIPLAICIGLGFCNAED